MPARPLSDETLHLIDALRTALEHRGDVEERTMFGCYCFFVDGKICIGVKAEELLVRLPPERHGELQEMQNTRELSPGGGMKPSVRGAVVGDAIRVSMSSSGSDSGRTVGSIID